MHLRIVTYNIHKCIGGLDRRFDHERVRSVIAHYHPDLVLMQEVDNQVERSRYHSLSDLLGKLLGLRHRAWFPNVSVRGGGEYGNALLSRFPISWAQNIDLTIPPRKRRSVLHARCRVRLPSGAQRTLHVYNLHLAPAGGGGGQRQHLVTLALSWPAIRSRTWPRARPFSSPATSTTCGPAWGGTISGRPASSGPRDRSPPFPPGRRCGRATRSGCAAGWR